MSGVPPVITSEWVLECGCEPEIEHCAQCDERRAIRSRRKEVLFLRTQRGWHSIDWTEIAAITGEAAS